MELFVLLTAYYCYMLDWSLFISFSVFVKMCVFSKLVYYLTYNDNSENIIYDYIKSFYLGIIIIKNGLGDTFRFFPLTNLLLTRYEYLNKQFKLHILQNIVIQFYKLIIYLISCIILYKLPSSNLLYNNNNKNYNNLHDNVDIDNFLNDLSHFNMGS
jgi:hypothetical protein